MLKLNVVFFLLWITIVYGSQCQPKSQLPTQYDNRHYLCAIVYEGYNCGNMKRYIYNGQNIQSMHNEGLGWNDIISSLQVMPGCVLHTWENGFYSGYSMSMGTNYPSNLIYWYNDKITSLKCKCSFSNAPLQCTPTERYETVATCINTGTEIMQCTRTVKHGMTLGRSVTQGKSVSNEISMNMGFQEIFSLGLSASTTTTYNWETTNRSDFSREVSLQVACKVPEGKTVMLKQVWGRCGDTVVKTPHYKCDKI